MNKFWNNPFDFAWKKCQNELAERQPVGDSGCLCDRRSALHEKQGIEIIAVFQKRDVQLRSGDPAGNAG